MAGWPHPQALLQVMSRPCWRRSGTLRAAICLLARRLSQSCRSKAVSSITGGVSHAPHLSPLVDCAALLLPGSSIGLMWWSKVHSINKVLVGVLDGSES